MLFEAWAAQKLFARVCQSLSSPASPAHPLLHPAASRLWFQKRSTWLTTGWKMIWGKFSRRRREGFEWSREGRTPTHFQQPEARTDSLTQTQPAEVMSLFHFFFFLFCFILCRSFSHYVLLLSGSALPSSSSRSLSLKKNGSLKPHQVKMTQMPGMVRLGRREVSRPHSPTITDNDDMRPESPPPHIHIQVGN